MNEITVTIEIACVIFASKLNTLDSIKLKMNPKIFMMNRQKKLRPGMSVSVVANDLDNVNLVLPYYTDLESQKAAHATTDVLERAVGGIGSFARNATNLDERVMSYIHSQKSLSSTINILAN